ncbi:hypothetical protein SAMN04244572_02386 [Azotobacter beijerinckii]|uniref:Uncharacterized protein n=1 Tax=Azotobacter beijerinckii TaxID=170623 RepID=A0A1H6V595_9GAMM|nr:DUF6631 family protein [Azotobacter beijerinckii]SEI99733.1 hypothetical protein SAMN04244572_02386 [Azotobacter beijerinckii]
MAKKREPRKAAAGSDDLEVLHPERTAVIAGRKITVREYGFVEGLRLQPKAEPIVAALQGFIGVEGTILDAVLAVAAEHADAVVHLLAVAADVEDEWVESLGQADGHLLLMMWWGANGPFYLRRAALQWLAAQAPAGATSTPPSSAPATEAPPTSAG